MLGMHLRPKSTWKVVQWIRSKEKAKDEKMEHRSEVGKMKV